MPIGDPSATSLKVFILVSKLPAFACVFLTTYRAVDLLTKVSTLETYVVPVGLEKPGSRFAHPIFRCPSFSGGSNERASNIGSEFDQGDLQERNSCHGA